MLPAVWITNGWISSIPYEWTDTSRLSSIILWNEPKQWRSWMLVELCQLGQNSIETLRVQWFFFAQKVTIFFFKFMLEMSTRSQIVEFFFSKSSFAKHTRRLFWNRPYLFNQAVFYMTKISRQKCKCLESEKSF